MNVVSKIATALLLFASSIASAHTCQRRDQTTTFQCDCNDSAECTLTNSDTGAKKHYDCIKKEDQTDQYYDCVYQFVTKE